MLSLLTLLATLGSPTAAAAPTDRPPLQIWMNNERRFREGDRVRLQIDADVEGYLLVVNYDTDGRLRVLFPLDPRDDALVRAGRRYEVRGDDGTGAFRAGADGSGFIYSAIAREPWRFDDVVIDGRWDYSRLSVDRDSDNPEQAITDLVQQLSGPGGFDYDVADYRVYGTTVVHDYSYGDYGVRGPIYVYDDYLYCNDWYWRFSGCRRYPFDGGWSFGFSYYPYSYRSYGYGYYPYSYPYYPYGSRYTYNYRRPFITGRPRSYTVNPRPVPGTGRLGGGFTPRGPAREATGPSVNWRPRSVARPVNGRPEARGPSNEGGRVFVPPARRARGAEGRPMFPSGNERNRGSAAPRGSGREQGDWSPPARREPRSNDVPRASGRDRGADRSPPPRAEPRSNPAPRGQPSGARDGGGNRGRENGGGRSAPSRPRHP